MSDCVCGGTGIVTRLTDGGGNTGPEVCTRCYVRRVPRNEVSEAAAESAREFPGGWTFNAFPPPGYNGRMFVVAAVRLGDHAHVEVRSGRWVSGPSGGTPNVGLAGRLVLRWDEWLDLREVLEELTPWRIAEVENPRPEQLKRYAAAAGEDRP